MGDSNRNIVFANFIKRNFPIKTYGKVLVVADGKGELSCILAKMGYEVAMMEAKPRWKAKNIPRIKRTKGWFTADKDFFPEANLIVGMHPDEATVEIVEAARDRGVSWAVVPCCIKGRHSENVKSKKSWRSKLKSIEKRITNETILPITGENVVLWKR